MSLIDSLNHILEWHQKNDTPVARLIQPGLGEDEIAGLLKDIPFKLPREFVELYKWHNGVGWDAAEEDEDDSFFEYHRFLPLNEAVEVFQDPASDGYGISGGPTVTDQAPGLPLRRRRRAGGVRQPGEDDGDGRRGLR